ncbi:helix-turn-helix transcriptional regulator [Streptomyces sp. UNOB3_S3]|uniref:helix-turn-helix transcriptional regulator n=1 Tax=Streptomyces sp. UNOB3_S3 TaxID=2871682 RepID=UPI001E2B4091|nr:helix-turn-helix transcriptional regulator [Streptomyces sp. UNOB3_S3]
MTGSIGANIRHLRERIGWSQARLARETCRAAGVAGAPIGRQEISRYETGRRKPREWLPFLAAALGVSVETITGPPLAIEPPLPSLTDYLPAADPLTSLKARRGRRVGTTTVIDLRQRVHGLRLADDVIAGGDLIRPALRELRSAVRLYRESSHSESTGRDILAQIGELAQITGWIASDAGQHAEAEAVYRLGICAARQAGDMTLVGNLAGSLAYQLSNTGREREGTRLARAALDGAGPDAPPKARALYLDRVAWAHAKTGQRNPPFGLWEKRAKRWHKTAPGRSRRATCTGWMPGSSTSWSRASTQNCVVPSVLFHCSGTFWADTTPRTLANWPSTCHGWPSP